MITIDHTTFWIIIWPLLGFMMYGMRRNRWGWGGSRQDRYGRNQPDFDPEPLLKEIDAQREQIEELSSRLAELENRADFTERLLAGRTEAVSQKP